jgi:polyamine oxidase
VQAPQALVLLRRFADAGIAVTIIEGRDRIGGRVHTNTSLGVPVDLGAAWIHGINGNPLTELAKLFGVERFVTDADNSAIYDANGNEVDKEQLGEVLAGLEDLDFADGATIGEVVREAIDDLDVLAPLADGIDVQLGRVVSWIGSGDEGVEVEFDDKSAVPADRVIITVPLGVLKAEVFWDAEVDLIGYVNADPGVFIEWDNRSRAVGAPIITDFNAGSVAERIEAIDDDAIIALATDALSKIYG